MNLIEMILNNTDLVKQIGGQVGLGKKDTKNALDSLLPSINRGVQNNVQKPGGLEALIKAIQNGNHDKYVDNPQELGRKKTIKDGNDILGHIFGNKKVSRNVAEAASQESGIDSSILKKLLPIVASVVMGSMGKAEKSGNVLSDILGQVLQGGGQQPQQRRNSGGGLGGILGGLLGGLMGGGNKRQQQNNDLGDLGDLGDFLQTGGKKSNSELDAILNMAKKYIQ